MRFKAVISALLRYGFWLSLTVLIVSGLGAQVSEHHHQRIGFPQDWSHTHLIFTRAATEYPSLAAAEPRVLHQWLRQHASLLSPATGSEPVKRDWSVSLGGGRIAAGMSPAKYGFDTTAAPSCTSDYVVFGLNVAGGAGQANVIAFNQLYSGTGGLCGTGGPSVLFAYNVSTIGGRIATSPILSLDGTKIGFVETTNTGAVFHVLTWASGAGNGTSATTPAIPGTGNTASMVNISLGTNSISRSSPWIDYNTDTVYVGNNSGRVYKITGVFKGTPTLAGAPWPVLASPSKVLTSPVLDPVTGNIFVGDGSGLLVSFNSITPGVPKTLAVGQAGQTGANILDAPIVDAANGVVYAVSSNDGTSAVLVQATTSNLTQLARARIGLGSTGGTNVTMYDGTPDDNYFNSISTGHFYVCGTGAASTSPTLYVLGFTGSTLNATGTSTQLVSSTTARCSPITEFFNPNVSGGTDFLFFGITQGCVGATGCVISRTTAGTTVTAPENGGTSGIVIDNQSTAGQASSIYFSRLGGNTGIKVTQSTLQ